MGKKTRIVYECDKCGKALNTVKDGLVFRGCVHAPDSDEKPLIGVASEHRTLTTATEFALCWPCITKVAPDPELEVLREKARRAEERMHSEAREAQAARERAERAEHRAARETPRETRYESSFEPRYERPGGGPSGPLPPPELPHAVRAAQALCGVSGRSS